MRLDTKDLVDKKFQNKNQFAKAIGVGYPAACKLYDGDTSKINFDTLERICIALECTPTDLFKSDDPALNRLLLYYCKLHEFNEKNEKDDTE